MPQSADKNFTRLGVEPSAVTPHAPRLENDRADIIAIGCGPANLALAAAVQDGLEQQPIRMMITDRAAAVHWQPDMLIPWARSQTSFVKDLVTFRDPRSHFSFLNFLKMTGRLVEFANLGTLYPYRLELSNYLAWVAENLSAIDIRMNWDCVSLEPIAVGDRVREFRAVYRDGRTVQAPDIVVGIGRTPNIPDAFSTLPPDRCVHSSGFLSAARSWRDQKDARVAVIGAGQSAAEIFLSIPEEITGSSVTVIMRGLGFRNSETSKFLDEFYYPDFVDVHFGLSAGGRKIIADEVRHTNYAGVTPVMLEALYMKLYLERLQKTNKHEMLIGSEVIETSLVDGSVRLRVRNRMTNEVSDRECDSRRISNRLSSQPAGNPWGHFRRLGSLCRRAF
ncbi:L-ornithine 5-monooxygenase [Agrobacterium sp. DSM 25558]|uniref:SidA/IucD/PvdA family monooxygenase n=1 Tax=Agrobacterium sp. DSM 25558 TaxID=1907665 RepID=UPI0009725906|nr:SidA/IucD/PvdA family monooxygenase [Agrobacterium sp. DSM 25558]SCX22981.1 L-ornithine 5-monooxygenase [Agrobacterium sp. DSM 25558]